LGGTGADAVWLSNDDVIKDYTEYTAHGNSNTRAISYSDSGADLQWFTVDDVVSSYSATVPTAKANTSVSATFISPGDDSLWFTDDDVPRDYFKGYSGTSGIQMIAYNHAGPDKIWFTADDAPSFYYREDQQYNVITTVYFSSPCLD